MAKTLTGLLIILGIQIAGSLAASGLCGEDGSPKSREKYCMSANPEDVARCLNCYIGPRCPVKGNRTAEAVGEDGLLLIRGIKERKIQRLILAMLNKRRLNEATETGSGNCIPYFTWDKDLAAAAQAWADQCALVEYDGSQPRKLHHDPVKQRSSVVKGRGFFSDEDTGIAQTVHWARTASVNLRGPTLEALLESDLVIEEGLIDGPYINQNDGEQIALGHATHVGCGWIQFPSTSEAVDSLEPQQFENFMVCNYGVGVASKTSCTREDNNNNNNNPNQVTYYSVTSEVIRDVKACLEAVKCRRRKRRLLKQTPPLLSSLTSDPCAEDIKTCLKGSSGLKFVDPSKLKSVARSANVRPIDVEAAKCKIDTILCEDVNATSTASGCAERLRKCLPLLDLVEAADGTGNTVECECADLVLEDGTRGDCTDELPVANSNEVDVGDGRLFCFVKQSPCATIDFEGRIELSKPYLEANSLIHYTHSLC